MLLIFIGNYQEYLFNPVTVSLHLKWKAAFGVRGFFKIEECKEEHVSLL